jgi:hypothetical protein
MFGEFAEKLDLAESTHVVVYEPDLEPCIADKGEGFACVITDEIYRKAW